MTTERLLLFADLLRQVRQTAGLTQEGLAAQTGLGVRTISDLERGISRTPRLDTLTRLANALDLADEDRASFMATARLGRIRMSAPRHPSSHPPQGHLPSPLTPLIGREHEEASITNLLGREEVRLLTLTGAPGIGKTRLAIQVAVGVRPHYSDGVAFVELATIREPELVLPALAQALGVRDAGSQPLQEALTEYCASRHMLLVVDNFEQVLAAAALVGELLAACPALKVLVTSRAVLHLRGEQEFVVSPLALPHPSEPLPALDDLSRYSAVTLFVQRARAVRPTFQLTTALAPMIVQICQRLDGLPLAIELAAARTKVLAPRELLTRLERSLDLLGGGAQDLPERQRTLRGAIAWSESLLSAEEQALFRRMGVFVGGWALDAAEAVCASDTDQPSNVLDGLTALVDKSLVQLQEAADGRVRFGLLEMLRDYALERLEEHVEMASLRRRHAEYFMTLAEQAEQGMRGPEQLEWLERLEREHDNLRAALDWAWECGDTEVGLRLANGAWRYWYVRGHLTEGRKWLEMFITLDADQEDSRPVGAARAKALSYLGTLVFDQGDFAHAIALQEASLVAWRELGDRSGIAIALNHLANAVIYQGYYARAVALYEESLALRRDLGDNYAIAIVLNNLGFAADNQGAYAQAEQYHQECLALWRDLEDKVGIAESLQSLGEVALHQGEYARAQALLEECLTLSRDLKNKTTTAYCLANLGAVVLRQGEYAQAASMLEESRSLFQDIDGKRGIAYALLGLGDLAQTQGDLSSAAVKYRESLTLFRSLGSLVGMIDNLEGLGKVAKAEGRWEDAVSLYASAAAARETLGAPVSFVDRAVYERDLAELRGALGEQTFARVWADGQILPLEEALATVEQQAEARNR